MDRKSVQILLNYNFGDYLKERLDEHDMTLRQLSIKTGIDYIALSKITSSRPRKTTYQEFIAIMWALNEDVEDFLDYALKRPKVFRITREAGRVLNVNELASIARIMRLKPYQRDALFGMIDSIVEGFLKANENNWQARLWRVMYFLQFVFDSVGVDCDEAAV